MPELLTFEQTEQGWALERPPEMARAAGAAEGSYLVIYLKDGRISTEILPPANEEMKQSVQESITQFKDAFEEMKRLGD